MNLKCKIISNIKIFIFFIIHVVIKFSENIKNYGCVLRKEWTHHGLLKWWHYVCHTKNEKCGLKKYEWTHCGLLKWWHYVCHTWKIKNVDSKNMNGFIVDFWNDDTMFVTQKKWKMWTQKICHSIIKIKIEK
jgi:hypothetical protein